MLRAFAISHVVLAGDRIIASNCQSQDLSVSISNIAGSYLYISVKKICSCRFGVIYEISVIFIIHIGKNSAKRQDFFLCLLQTKPLSLVFCYQAF